MPNFLKNLLNGDQRRVNTIDKKMKEVDALAQTMASLSDDQLKAKTQEFKDRLANGSTLDDILIEAFALVREACTRVLHMTPFHVQLMGAYVLHQGDIAEMKTGEGKTLTETMPVYLNALTGQGVHVVTVNEYLASRDREINGPVYEFLGLTVGLNLRQLTPAQKRAAYECDITYTTNAELGFDYLRDNMVTKKEDRVLRGLNYALIDEVDSILIDEARTPLIISGGKQISANLYIRADQFAKSLTANEDYTIDIQSRSVSLTDSGVDKAERMFKVSNLFDLSNTSLVHFITQALKANYIMRSDIEYMVDKENDLILIIDQNTGRTMPGREYSDGLHQAIEAKEGITIKQETVTLATITYQNFFRLYNKLCGMTGTAKTEEEEFLEIYNMRVVEIPTNRPMIRVDHPDAIFGNKKAKFNALVNEVLECHAKGQPVLVGTISVETSELISKMLKSRRIHHEVLNAKNHAREAEIIARAGQKNAVTIATNMAGRGTDIKLGEGVVELGGLAVLGSERHESRRIDNQLRGRSGRQGDPGYSRFYVSIEDELMQRFGAERMQGAFQQLGDEALHSKTITKFIEGAQRRVEGANFDARKTLLGYDDVMRQQREIMYEQRNFILDHEDVHEITHGMFETVVSGIIHGHMDEKGHIDVHGVLEALQKMGLKENVDETMLTGKDEQTILTTCVEGAWKIYEDKIAPVRKQVMPIERTMVLKMIDQSWVNHIDMMSKLREGIGLRGYAQTNPLQAYVEEGYQLFEEMKDQIARNVVMFCLNVKIVINPAPNPANLTPEQQEKAKELLAKRQQQAKELLTKKQAALRAAQAKGLLKPGVLQPHHAPVDPMVKPQQSKTSTKGE